MFGRILGFYLAATLLAAMLAGCSNGEAPAKLPAYAENVQVTIKLGPSGDLINMNKDDVFFTVTNNGDKPVKELKGDIVFRSADGQETGRVRWIFIQENSAMRGIAVGEKKAKWSPLPPGGSLTLSSDKSIFFAGKDRPLQEKLTPQWDSIKAEAAITKLVVDE